MRATWNNPKGSLALVALCFTAVIGITLASYLALSYQSMQHSERTLQLSRARHLAETGLEEALWSLNSSTWTNATWTITGANISCTITGYALDEGATGQVALTILNYAGNTPTINAVATVTPKVGPTLTKTLSATTKSAPLFPNAIGVVNGNNGTVTFTSGGTVDSWNSNPSGDNATFVAYSWTGLAANYTATIAAPNITLNSAIIDGYVTTFGNSVTVAPASSQVKAPVGPAAPTSTTFAGVFINTARVGKSAFVPAYPVAVPASYTVAGWLDGTGQTIGVANGATQYWVSSTDWTLSGPTVTVQGPVVIIVQGNMTVQSGARIVINSTGNSRLEMFVSGDVNIGITPAGSTTWLNNLTNEPWNLAIYSTSTSSSRIFNYYNNHDFCGVLYSASPSAPIVFDTGVATTISGAILANDDVIFNAGTTPTIHYDSSLQTLPKGWLKGVTTPFIVVQITET